MARPEMKSAATATIITAVLLVTPTAALADPGATTTQTTTATPAAQRTASTQKTSSTPRTTTTRTTGQTSPGTDTVKSGTTTTTDTTTTPTTTTPATVPSTTITTSPPVSPSTIPSLAPRAANLASGRAALTAYASYLQTLVASQAASQNNAAAYTNTVESGCKSALEPLTEGVDALRPAVQFTLTELGKEIGDDLAISYDQVAQTPLQRLATTLERLRWAHGGHNQEIITGYVSAETALITLPQSQLCQDVLLAASEPKMAPTGTHAFIKQYEQAVQSASSALAGLLVLLRAYETSSDQALVARTQSLARQFVQDSKSDLLATGQQLTTSLETS